MIYDGVCYVPVSADDSMNMMPMNALSADGSGGVAGGDEGGMALRIPWTYSGGIINLGWTLGNNIASVIYVPGNVELTNQNITSAAKKMSPRELLLGTTGQCIDWA